MDLFNSIEKEKNKLPLKKIKILNDGFIEDDY